MDRRTVQRDARVERLLVRADALEARQQRRMNVQQPALISSDEFGRQDAHEAREHDEIGREAVDLGGERRIEAVAAVERPMVDHRGRNAVRCGKGEAGRVGPVGDHGGDLGRPAFVRACADDGLHVAAATGNQDHEFFIREFYHSAPRFPPPEPPRRPNVYNLLLCGIPPPIPDAASAIVKVFRGLPNAESRAPCALTIGNFDGVHRGHQALLARVRAAANARGLPVCVMTFEPHPREFFNPAGAPPRIAMLRDKLEALREHGVDRVVVEHFNHTFASQSPQAFVERTLVNGLHTRWMMVGDDFCYGAKRAGTFDTLKAAGEQYGFEVEQMGTIAGSDGTRISSSGVRTALAAGDLEAAASALGHSYAISGHVAHGLKLGRDLGFPTLNLPIAHKRPALSGIFVVQVHGLGPHRWPASRASACGRPSTIPAACCSRCTCSTGTATHTASSCASNS